MIEAANMIPSFIGRQSITAEQLRHVSEPCVVFEADWLDDDGARCYAYTLGGWMDGRPLGGMLGGVTVGGEVMIVHADNRQNADALASLGLQDTINALHDEEASYVEAHAALARLAEVGPLRRIELATAAPADLSDEFVNDSQAIRKLRGDDVVLGTGGVE